MACGHAYIETEDWTTARQNMAERPVPTGDKPRTEPEIIPPGATDARWNGAPRWSSAGTYRVHVTRIGPFGFFLIALAIAALAVLLLILVLGAFLLWIPIAGLLLAIAVISGLWRGRRAR
jgi:hypothetical protein